MTSYFAQHGILSPQTREAFERYGRDTTNKDHLIYFYTAYFIDVVPLGVYVHHIPHSLSTNNREEFELQIVSGRVLMSGLISTGGGQQSSIEEVAAGEAYTKWQDGEFVRGAMNWSFFTGLTELRFFQSVGEDSWELDAEFHPIWHAEYVAAYFQEEIDKVRAQY